MKFGKRMMTDMDQSWMKHYVDYKILKKIIKGFHTGVVGAPANI